MAQSCQDRAVSNLACTTSWHRSQATTSQVELRTFLSVGRLPMFRPPRTLLFLVALAALLDRVSAHAEEADARLIREARELFRVIKAGELPPGSERCSVEPQWSSASIPEEIARAQFGLRLHGNLAAPLQGSNPVQVLELGNDSKTIFCDEREQKAYRESRIASLASGRENSIFLGTSSYTFPVFNDAYTKAIVIHSSFGSSWYRDESGVHADTLGFGSTALVFGKRKGRWQQTASISLDGT